MYLLCVFSICCFVFCILRKVDCAAPMANEEIKNKFLVSKVLEWSFESMFFFICCVHLVFAVVYLVFRERLIALHLWRTRRSRICFWYQRSWIGHLRACFFVFGVCI